MRCDKPDDAKMVLLGTGTTESTFDGRHARFFSCANGPGRRKNIIEAVMDDELNPEASARHAWLDAFHPSVIRVEDTYVVLWRVQDGYVPTFNL